MKNKERKNLLGILFLTVGLLSGFYCVRAGTEDLIISEIMYDPAGTDAGHTDWIELHNPTSGAIIIPKNSFGLIDEATLELGKDGVHYLNCHSIASDLPIGPGEFVILADKASDFAADYPESAATVVDSTFSLSSNGDTLRLSRDKCATFFVELGYDDSWGGSDNGRTLEKKKYDSAYDRDGWQESYVIGGTPGAKSSEKPEPKIYSNKVRLNEILPNPSGSEGEKEFIELYNDSIVPVDLEGWALKDTSKSKAYTFPKGISIAAEDFILIYRSAFKFSLNNTGSDVIYLFDPSGEEKDKVSYEGSHEDVSYNYGGGKWRWSRFLTPGEENVFDGDPNFQVKRDKNVYKKMTASFEVKVKNYRKGRTKIVWDFGDGHKSYKRETTHKYEKKGKYKASVKVFSGSEEMKKEFTVEVKNYPKHDVEIVRLTPNPEGRDTDFETITLRNNSKKKINLQNWSIATGGKKMVNHPIKSKLVIGPQAELEITRIHSRFSLNNKKGKIELRYPNGKTADKVKYDKGAGSVQEGESFVETDKGWVWKNIVRAIAPPETENIITEASVIEEEIVETLPEIEKKDYREELSLWLIDRSIFTTSELARTENGETPDFLKFLFLGDSIMTRNL